MEMDHLPHQNGPVVSVVSGRVRCHRERRGQPAAR